MGIQAGLMSGKAIMKEIVAGKLMSGIFGLEMLYSFVIILCSLMIYFSTKELYELSNHKGIKYFRLAFLFFGISYGMRILLKVILIQIFPIRELVRSINHFSVGLLLYLGIMSVFFLLYSVMHKKWKNERLTMIIFNIAAVASVILMQVLRSRGIYFLIHIALFLIVLIIIGVSRKDSSRKKTFDLHIIYVLLAGFMMLNILDVVIPNFFAVIQLLIYMASIGLFMTILYKVLTRVGCR